MDEPRSFNLNQAAEIYTWYLAGYDEMAAKHERRGNYSVRLPDYEQS
jgi:hypothetical protein